MPSPRHLRMHVITDTLGRIGLYDAGLVELLVLTAAVESGGQRLVHEDDRIGLFGLRESRHDALWSGHLARHAQLAEGLRMLAGTERPAAALMIVHLGYAAAMAAVAYAATLPRGVPEESHPGALAALWRRHYAAPNRHAPAPTDEDREAAWHLAGPSEDEAVIAWAAFVRREATDAASHASWAGRAAA